MAPACVVPILSATTQVFFLIFNCRGTTLTTKREDVEEQPRQPLTKSESLVSIITTDSIEFETLDTTWVEEVPAFDERSPAYSPLDSTVRSRCNHLSIMHKKEKRSFFTVKESEQQPFVDPLDEKAAQMAEEEDEERDWKPRAQVSSMEQKPRKESWLRRSKTRFDSKVKKTKA